MSQSIVGVPLALSQTAMELDKMDKAIADGASGAWSQEQYKEALYEIIFDERSKLRSGERALNKHKRPWAEEQRND